MKELLVLLFATCCCVVAQRDIPSPRSDHSLSIRAADAMFLFGGLGESQQMLRDFWKFEIATRRWIPIGGDGTATPGKRCWHKTVVRADSTKLLLFGGFNGTHDLNDLWRFNFAENQWREIKPITLKPPPRDRHSMVWFGKSVFVYGGYNGEFASDMWQYNTEDNAWTNVEYTSPSSQGPGKRRSHATTIMNQHMFLFGGQSKFKHFADLWMFSFDDSTFTLVQSTPSPSRRLRTQLLSDRVANLWMFGGFDGANYKFDLWKFEDNEGWEKEDPNDDRPTERADFGAVFHKSTSPLDQGRAYFFGGFDGKNRLNDMHLFDVASNAWSVVVPDTEF